MVRTVEELIEELQRHNPKASVAVMDCEGREYRGVSSIFRVFEDDQDEMEVFLTI